MEISNKEWWNVKISLCVVIKIFRTWKKYGKKKPLVILAGAEKRKEKNGNFPCVGNLRVLSMTRFCKEGKKGQEEEKDSDRKQEKSTGCST